MPGEYHGLLSHCFYCKRKFQENDAVALAPLGIIFCVPVFGNGKDCIVIWSRERKIVAIVFDVKIFKGGRREYDDYDIETV